MAACTPEPAVTNSKAPTVTDDNDTMQAFYECLTGFSMSGSPRISCNKTLDVWETAPTCTTINDNVYVYNNQDSGHDWWYYFLAALLTALLFLLLALVIWCCCWAPRSYFYDCRCCCCRQRSRRLHDPTVHASSNGARKEVFWIDSNDNKYWSNQALGHYLYSDISQNGSLTSLLTNRRQQPGAAPPARGSITTRDIGVEAQLGSPSTSQGHQNPLSSRSNKFSSASGGVSSQKSSMIVSGSNVRSVLTEVDTPDRSSTSKSTTREIQVSRATRPAKDPTKDTKIWMPHTHSIRDINTSTK